MRQVAARFVMSRRRLPAAACSTAPKPCLPEAASTAPPLRTIAREAGATTGALYSNFASKEDLFLALFEERIATDVGDYSQIVAAGDDASRSRPAGRRDHWMAILRERPELLSRCVIEFWAYAIREPRLRERLAGRFAALRSGQCPPSLSEGAERLGSSHRAPRQASALGVLINALGNGLALEKLLDPDAVPDRAVRRHAGAHLPWPSKRSCARTRARCSQVSQALAAGSANASE